MDQLSQEDIQKLIAQLGNQMPSASEGTGMLGNPLEAAKALGHGVVQGLPDEAPNIVDSVGKLKALSPLYTYALYHPVRFLLKYLILPLPSLLLFLVISILQILAFLLKTLLFPFSQIFFFAIRPFRIAFNVLESLMPLWIFLATALFIGASVGAGIGLLMGSTTRHAFEIGIDVAMWPLRYTGIVPPKSSTVVEEEGDRSQDFGAKGGARLESIPSKTTTRNGRRDMKGEGGMSDATTSKVKKEGYEETTTDESEAEFRTKRRFGVRAAADIRRSSASSSDEEEDRTESRGIRLSSGRKTGNKESGWRARHVEGVL